MRVSVVLPRFYSSGKRRAGRHRAEPVRGPITFILLFLRVDGKLEIPCTVHDPAPDPFGAPLRKGGCISGKIRLKNQAYPNRPSLRP